MKTTPSSYILVAELVVIILFHAVKIRQSERHASEVELTKLQQKVHLNSPNSENTHSSDYIMVNMMK